MYTYCIYEGSASVYALYIALTPRLGVSAADDIKKDALSIFKTKLNCRFNFFFNLIKFVPDLYFKPSAYTAVIFTGSPTPSRRPQQF